MIQLDETKLAEWWCSLNASIWPADFPPMLRSGPLYPEEQCAGAWRVVNLIAGEMGRELWAKRCRAKLDPATGLPREAAPC